MTVYGEFKYPAIYSNVGVLAINNANAWKECTGYFNVVYYARFQDRDWYNILNVVSV